MSVTTLWVSPRESVRTRRIRYEKACEILINAMKGGTLVQACSVCLMNSSSLALAELICIYLVTRL
ncbi:hypothetical protein [Bradyrhizobium vignae]|uniref:Transposase n=1 Tax=Bradyrhizobium vignae TaxID=1549949 RepID=A0ABS4A6K4_9BRAD|nr:hypothetical protein [Bradyrhizobium vignae]MBP0116042.1 hypothetical protein [Bradyrhizobium vignae]